MCKYSLLFLCLSLSTLLLAQPGNSITFRDSSSPDAFICNYNGAVNGRNSYQSAQNPPLDILINWSGNRWEILTVANAVIVYFSNYDIGPNPPEFNTGNWQTTSTNNLLQLDGSGTQIVSLTFDLDEAIICAGSNSQTLGGGAPAGGTYSGPGVTDNNNGVDFTFDPTAASPGTAIISYGDNNNQATSSLQVNPTLSTNLASSSDITCTGLNDGVAAVDVTGGTPPYSYFWSNGSTDQVLTNLYAGIYSIFVVDANGCSITNVIGITEPDSLSTTASSSSDITCTGLNDGVAAVDVTGGTPPYSYFWSNGSTGQVQTNLYSGIYQVVVIDANGCSTTNSIAITEPESLSTTVSSNDDFDNNGTATVSVSGGTPPYSYLWDNGSTTATNTGLSAGVYDVLITDANNCTTFASVEVMTGFIPPPSNECVGSIDVNALFGGPLSEAQTSTIFDNTNFTTTSSDPLAATDCFYDDDPTQSTIWYNFIGDGARYKIETVSCNTDINNYLEDTQISLYSGDCNNLTLVTCNEDQDFESGLYNISLGFNTEIGLAYSFFIDGFNGSQGQFCLEVTRLGSTKAINISNSVIEVFPNPVKDNLQIRNIDADQLQLFNADGRLLLHIKQPRTTIDVSILPSGIYFIHLTKGSNQFIGKVVKT